MIAFASQGQQVEIAVAVNQGVQWFTGTVVDLHPSTDPHEDFFRAKVLLADGRVLMNVHPDRMFPVTPEAAFR